MIRILKNILLVLAGIVLGRRTKDEPVEPPPPGWRLFWKRLAMLVPLLAVGGFLLAASGIVPIKASSGHWGITAWLLDFAKTRSVSTHTIGMAAPPLDDSALVVKGAGHYETACRACHGSVESQPRLPREMTPQPPHLPARIPRWDPEELFYIVKHGIKFTGMPAWPSRQRDDEVWSVVAFLTRLPDLSADGYDRLVYGSRTAEHGAATARTDTAGTATARTDTAGASIGDLPAAGVPSEAAPEVVRRSCARCHGLRGEGRSVSAFPRLAGQRPEYLYASLRAYTDGERHSGIMGPVAATLSDEEMRDVARYFAESEAAPRLIAEPGPARSSEDPGRRIAFRGVPQRKVPSCAHCHGPVAHRRNPYYPILAGQFADYLALQLELFRDGRRGGSAFAHIMHESVARLTDAEIQAVARYYESLSAP